MPEGLQRGGDGTYTVANHVCDECGEAYIVRRAHVATSKRHQEWLHGGLQPEIEVPKQEPGLKYNDRDVPARLVFGVSAPCPRCHGKATFNKKLQRMEPRTFDPHRPSQICPRCDGFGIVPATSI